MKKYTTTDFRKELRKELPGFKFRIKRFGLNMTADTEKGIQVIVSRLDIESPARYKIMVKLATDCWEVYYNATLEVAVRTMLGDLLKKSLAYENVYRVLVEGVRQRDGGDER